MGPAEISLARIFVIVGALISTVVAAVTGQAGPAPTPVPEAHTSYTQEQLDYFSEIVPLADNGSDEKIIYKWTSDVRISFAGDPTSGDIQTAKDCAAVLSTLTGNISVTLSDSNPNIIIYIGTSDRFADYLTPPLTPGILKLGGMQSFEDNLTGHSVRGAIVENKTMYNQTVRSAQIRNSLASVMGAKGLTSHHPDSIFNYTITGSGQYTSMDMTIISMIYDDRVKPGMTGAEAVAALKS